MDLGKMLSASRAHADIELSTVDADDAVYTKRLDLGRHVWRIAAIVLTLAYVAFEVRWNIDLVRAISVGAEREKIQSIVDAGRWLAALGIVWAVSKSLVVGKAAGPGKAGIVALVVVAIVMMHSILNEAFDYLIDSLPAQTVMRAHQASVYRFMNASSIDRPETAVLVPLLAYSEAGRKKLEAAYEQAPLQAQNQVDSVMKDLGSKLDEFEQKRDPKQLALFEDGYKTFISSSKQLERGLKMFRGAAFDKFRAASGGLEPNSNATRLEFAQALTSSRMIEKRVAAKKYIAAQDGMTSAVAQIKAKLPKIQLDEGDLMAMSRDDLRSRMIAAATSEIEATLPTEGQVKGNAAGRAGAQAAILPLAAMVLSLAAVFANSASVIGLMFGSTKAVYPLAGFAAFMAAGFLFTGNPMVAQCADMNPVVLHIIKSAVYIETLLI